jgi:hypothetical protein
MDRDVSPDIQAQNFLKILGVIDRTILPRKILITSSSNSVTLMVSRRRASIPDWGEPASPERLQGLTWAIVAIAQDARPIVICLEASPPTPATAIGFTAIEIVNAQTPDAAHGDLIDLQNYLFTPSGWPLAAPPGASVPTLAAVARFACAVSNWQGRHLDKVKPPMLILAVSATTTSDISVSVGQDVVVAHASPAQLGQIVSKWQSEQKRNEKADR